MYNKNIWNNNRNIVSKFEEILTIGQIFANSRTIQQNPFVIYSPCKMLDFEQITESV